ncbi:Hsp33 family molecular chaperone HslO [Desulforhopalus singaporensis]|uniref:33 kDa chaperonin n=1 Tax=Desulforhopalus singaporensis TaxID=91360 RepID=A0A1H0L1Z9_9BACT|nr:Hsp33 family molecular chaperone HslO [Desulforhopalus singaporensis]SDO62076.1 molecular chaperone Hsp33 [Desulforhopalus singaporensis]
MADSIERVISQKGNFFGVACNTTDLVAKACRRHDVGPLAAAAIGRALTGAALLAALLKDNQSVMVKFAGNGPLGKVLAEAGYDGWVRGYVAAPHAELPLKNGFIDVAAGIGHAGLLTVVKKISASKTYPGTIPLYTSEVGDDLAYYLSQSEQTPSTIGLSVHLGADGSVAAAGGFLIQSLPPADETILTALEKNIARLPPLSQLLGQGCSPAGILSKIFGKIPHRTIHTRELSYQCSCSIEKMENALLSLGVKELEDLAEKDCGAEVQCEFCRQKYRFSRSELEKIAAQAQKPFH